MAGHLAGHGFESLPKSLSCIFSPLSFSSLFLTFLSHWLWLGACTSHFAFTIPPHPHRHFMPIIAGCRNKFGSAVHCIIELNWNNFISKTKGCTRKPIIISASPNTGSNTKELILYRSIRIMTVSHVAVPRPRPKIGPPVRKLFRCTHLWSKFTNGPL